MKEYYELYESGMWKVPDFSEKCLICNELNCARFLGIYTRIAICPIIGFEKPDLPVMRFRCHAKGKNAQCTHVTFSLLPLVLVPYRQLTLKFMILAVWIRLSRRLSFFAATDAITATLINLEDVGNFLNISTQQSWEKMVKFGFYLFITNNINLPGSPLCTEIRANHSEGLLRFLHTCIEYKTQFNNDPIRGPDGLALDFYYVLSEVTALAPFLFGTASQHRN